MGDTRFDATASTEEITRELETIGAQPVDRLIINLMGILHRVSAQLAKLEKELSTLQGLVPRMAAVEERLAHPDAGFYTDLVEGEQARRRNKQNEAAQQRINVEVAKGEISARHARIGMYFGIASAILTTTVTVLAKHFGWA